MAANDSTDVSVVEEPVKSVATSSAPANVSPTLLDSLYNQVMASIHKGSIDASDLIQITATAMILAQSQKQLTGAQKKELVIGIVNRLIDQSGLVKPEAQAACHLLVETALSAMIDTIVSAASGEYQIGNAIKEAKKCCTIM